MYRRPFFIGLFAVVLAFLAVLLFQGPILKWLIAGRARAALGLRLEMKDVAISWVKGAMLISGLAATGPSGFEDDTLMSADTVYAAVDWKSVLAGRPCFNRVSLVIPEITVVRNASGEVNFEKVGDKARHRAPGRKRGDRADEGRDSRGDAVFIRQGSLRLEKVTYKDYSGGTPAFVRTFPMPVSEIHVENVTWDGLAAGLGMLAAVGRSGPGPLLKALSGAKRLGSGAEKAFRDLQKRLKEAR